jgi:hypothetical protein
MTATTDTSTADHVEDAHDVAATPAEPTEQPETAKPAAKPHTNVPAPLAGPARRTALALGVPSVGLAELLVHANFGWAGVAAFTTVAAVGAGVVYAARRKQRATKTTDGSKVGASKTPTSLAARLRAKPLGHSPARAGGASAGGRGGSAPRGGLASRMMSRFAGRGGGAGSGVGRGGGLGGRSRGVAGRSGSRSMFGVTGHGGGRGGRTNKALSSPGARTAAAKSAQLTGRRPSKTSANLRKLSGRSSHRATGRSGAGAGLGGGSFFGGGGGRSSRPNRGRHGGNHGGYGGRRHTTSGGGHHGGRHYGGGRGRLRQSWRLRSPIRRPRLRTVATVAGALTLGTLAVPVVMAATALAGIYGGFRLATSPPVRYGASVIAGWVRLGYSRAYQWARAQFWKARGKTTAAEVFIADGETVDEPYAPTEPAPRARPVVDAEIVPEPQPAPPPLRELVVTARQPKFARTAPAPAETVTPRHQETSIVSALNDITASIAAAPAFTPTSGPDAERYLEAVVEVLVALGGRVSADLQTVAETLPQETTALGTLGSLGDVVSAIASQAGEQVEAWKQSANWVWSDQG